MASNVINKIENSIKELEKQTKKTKKTTKTGFDAMLSSVKDFAGAIGVTAIAGTAVYAVQNFAKESVNLAFQMEGLENAFNRMAGQSAPALLNSLNRASAGTVADIDAITAANRAMLLGIDQEALPQMMMISRAAAQAMGTDVTMAFNDIATGIGRQSKMILDNLGIMISVEEANKRYAEQLGTVASELSDAERKTAFLNEAMRIGTENMQNMGGAANTQKEEIQELAAEWKNFKTDVGEKAIGVLGKIAQRINLVTEANSKGLKVQGQMGTAIFFNNKFLQEYIKSVDSARYNEEEYLKLQEKEAPVLIERVDESVRLTEATKEYTTKLAELNEGLANGILTEAQFILKQKELNTQFESDADNIKQIIALQDKRNLGLKEQTQIMDDFVKSFGGEADFQRAKLEIDTGQVGATDEVKALFEEAAKSTKTLETNSKSLITDTVPKLITKNKELDTSVQDVTNSVVGLGTQLSSNESILQRSVTHFQNIGRLINSISGGEVNIDISVALPRNELLDTEN